MADTWLALACTRDGTIAQVLRDDLGLAQAGKRLTEIVDAGSARKAGNFLSALGERGSVVGWELNVPGGDGALPLYFTGVVQASGLPVGGETAGRPEACTTPEILIVALPAIRQEMNNQLYEELSRLNNELINRERELARKSAALERLAADKSRLLAIAAHDLRNPLTVVASYADLLRLDKDMDGEHALYVDEISRSARFMAELVEELLDAARLESGYVDVDLQDVDLSHAAQHAATINRLRADRKQILIRFEQKADGPVIIRADPVKLRQIVNNLLVNAIKFSRGGTDVIIRVRRTGDRALLEIEDQGIGIPPDKLSVIFEPYRTLGAAGTAGEKSTGLGLAIVHQLATLHGASVEVESEVGRGSLFRVVFPLAG